MLFLTLLCGCDAKNASDVSFQLNNFEYVNPLALQQRSRYAEAAQGRFVSLADFENTDPEKSQAGLFSSDLSHGNINISLAPSATGAASLAVKLRPGETLSFTPENTWELKPYTLLQVAIYMDHSRDDLRLTLKSDDKILLTSSPQIIHSGWNTVLVDISELSANADTAESPVRLSGIDLQFTHARDDINFNMDDILLVDNRRVLTSTPENLTVSRHGLNFSLSLLGMAETIKLKPNADGLFTLGKFQPSLSLTGPDHSPDSPDDITLMGKSYISTARILDANSCLVRLEAVWYFPPSHGQWVDLDVRRISWQYCFFGDGRVVISTLINNAGGSDINLATVTMPSSAAWPDGQFAAERSFGGFEYTIVEFSALMNVLDSAPETIRCGYNSPGDFVISTGSVADGFDTAFDTKTGCYVAKATAGNLRAVLRPAAQPIVRPVLKVHGNWNSDVSVSFNGLSVSDVVVYDSYILARINEILTREAILEVRGSVAGE